MRFFLRLLIATLILFYGCQEQAPSEKSNSTSSKSFEGFSKSNSKQTQIRFANVITETPAFNYYTYEYMYNGGGVAAGDVNNDGLEDLYFTGNQVDDKLYINEGDLKFKDVTKSAGIKQDGWHNGVTMVDLNADGWLDIYVCRSGPDKDGSSRSNLFYENNGDGTFVEKAQQLGIADTSRSVQSCFFDMDNDGDLDLFVGNHPHGMQRLNNILLYELLQSGKSPSDKLFRNDGGQFTDVTKTSGIYNFSYTLGISVADYNQDGFQDIFISADYEEPDRLYLNQGNGTFKQNEQKAFKHIANFGMGSDAADFNNDGLIDLFNLDMAYADHYRSKTNMPSMSTKKFEDRVKIGFHHQYMHNCLQQNMGNGIFSEVAYMNGIAKTDWSWATFFADFDNDMDKDLLVTNGYRRDVMNNDYLIHLKTLQGKATLDKVFEKSISTSVPNYLFENNNGTSFDNKSADWGFTENINSNGATYSDLDNDGDLDIIVNHMDKPSMIYENNNGNSKNYLKVVLVGKGKNVNALGAEIELYSDGQKQLYHQQPVRGYQSSVSPIIHIGLGKSDKVDSLIVYWPGNTKTTFKDLAANDKIRIDQNKVPASVHRKQRKSLLFNKIEKVADGEIKHTDKYYNDYEREILIPHKQSQNGPKMAIADVNGDNLDDFYVGGAAGQSGQLYLQVPNAPFKAAQSNPWSKHAASEDTGAHFFDADGDGDMDLYVVSGSNEFKENDPRYADRLYINTNGVFKSSNALPKLNVSGEAVSSADIDGDGDLDLFVGGRIIPGRYPLPSDSYLLLNNKGRFTAAKGDQAEPFKNLGMVTDALFDDIDKDGDQDLLVTGEWMPLTVFENRKGQFTNKTENYGLEKTNGWWWSINKADLDGDGDMDYVAGNLGKNSKFSASAEKPFFVYANDFDDSGNIDIVLTFEDKDGELKPVRGRECTSQQMPFIVDKFPDFNSFAKASIEEIHSSEKIENAIKYPAYNFESAIVWNNKGELELEPFEHRAQSAPVKSSILEDLDDDGNIDILLAGNMFHTEVETSRYDAGYGHYLKGDGKGGFTYVQNSESGFYAGQDVKDLASIKIGANRAILVANNNGVLETFIVIPQTASVGFIE